MYYDLSNEALVELIIKDSCSEKFEHLFRRFYNLLWKFYGQIKIPSYEMDDYRQEGRIVLYRSIQEYRFDRGVTFAPFYKTNLYHHLLNLYRMSQAQKRGAGMHEISYHDNFLSEDLNSYYMTVKQPQTDAIEERLIGNEFMQAYYQSLTPLENQVIRLMIIGLLPNDIASLLQRSRYQVDNALYRARLKFSKLMLQTPLPTTQISLIHSLQL